ncbi:ribonuclease II, chloroplastic/mitochondrial isoform X2 [Malus domestica]|uniref:ribonuclease II, chloroplastic/mitochondrial isoform X2 n=1 Tax=Malus domestica TaxID=3750 RepID=UPI0010A9D420|nr:ribonuclease II, chloroplastic/mitochondrial isoform X2 [Malus domestica]
MAVRATVGSCSIFRSASSSASSPTLLPFRCCPCHFPTLQFRRLSKLGIRFPIFRSGKLAPGHGSGVQSTSVHSLVDSVMEELGALRRRRLVPAAAKVELTSSGGIVEDKLVSRALQQGLLLEFKKDAERVLLAVAQKPDGKKNWMVSDQNGVTSSIKPQQITYIVPGVENFDHTDISDFIQKAQANSDPALLEFAWVELLEKNKRVTAEELAEVEELLRRKLAKEAAEKELQEFKQLLKSAKAMPLNAKPPKSSWLAEEKIRHKIESLEAYAIDACTNDDQRKTAGTILRTMGMVKTASSALNLLIDIGYFPVHVNLDLLKLNIRTDHSDGVISAAEHLLSDSSDLDVIERTDLTHLKVYAIDVDEADELDDALSATRLQDGRIKIWIHVADATRFVQPGSIVDREAMRRGTSVFLPTATYPMFPEKLAMEGMSLQQGEICNAVTVSVVLHSDGSIAEYSVDNSIIKPTYMLTYESASELLHLNLQEEAELKILSEAATLRSIWRREQGAIDTATLEARIKVVNPEDPEPVINLYVENQADPAMRLVTEMMVLCGEVIATFGSRNNIPLPYRGQPQSNIDTSVYAHLPEGPVRSSALVKLMRAAEIDFRKPIRHGILGLPGYVQFTSPIRRYMDLLAHYQVKSFLAGESLPFSAGQLEGMASIVNMNVRVARRLFSSSLRYWILEYLRRQPKEKKYRALILRFIKDRIAAILLVEVGLQSSVWISVGAQIGDEVLVRIEEAHPRDDVLLLKEVVI